MHKYNFIKLIVILKPYTYACTYFNNLSMVFFPGYYISKNNEFLPTSLFLNSKLIWS
jgi:hypothetical protein